MQHSGGCHCGAVSFRIHGAISPVVACHCTQCRKVSGHFWAAASVPEDQLEITEDSGLLWFQSSAQAKRGHCKTCGAALFWTMAGEGRISIAGGALDRPTGLHIAKHIFTEDAGDYYAPEGPPPAPTPAEMLHGSCLCGGNAFDLPGSAGDITACHCTQCRKLSGHYSASFDADEAAMIWHRQTTLCEYDTPGGGTRGHCATCGTTLYFRAADGAFSIEAGSLDGRTGGTLTSHIFCADKGDYYAITDGLPCHKAYD